MMRERGARLLVVIVAMGLTLVAGAQMLPISLDVRLSARDAATKAKVDRALEGISAAGDLAFTFSEFREGQVTAASQTGGSYVLLPSRPLHPTLEELLQRTERILTRLGYRKGVDFELEVTRSLPDDFSDDWRVQRPSTGGQLIRYRRPAFRGFFDTHEVFQFEWDLSTDSLVYLSVPGPYPVQNRVMVANALSAEQAAQLASEVVGRYQRQNRAFWSREDASPARLLQHVRAQWTSERQLTQLSMPLEISMLAGRVIPAIDQGIIVPAYSFSLSGLPVYVRADTREVIMPFFGSWSSPPSLSQQFYEMGMVAPRFSEFLVASTLGFWVLAPVLMLRAWRKRVRPKSLAVNDTPAAPDPPRATRPGTLT